MIVRTDLPGSLEKCYLYRCLRAIGSKIDHFKNISTGVASYARDYTIANVVSRVEGGTNGFHGGEVGVLGSKFADANYGVAGLRLTFRMAIREMLAKSKWLENSLTNDNLSVLASERRRLQGAVPLAANASTRWVDSPTMSLLKSSEQLQALVAKTAMVLPRNRHKPITNRGKKPRYTQFIASLLALLLNYSLVSAWEVSNRNHGTEFAELVHSGELCSFQDDFCNLPLRKRDSDYLFRMVGAENVISFPDKSNLVRRTLTYLKLIELEIGLSPIGATDRDSSKYIRVLFVDREELEADPAVYLQNNVIGERFIESSERHERLALFEGFVQSDLYCIAVSSIWEDYLIRDVNIWIKAHLAREDIESCLVEEIYNSFGLNEAEKFSSLFEYDFFRSASLDHLPSRSKEYLRMLYSAKNVNGQNIMQTLARN
ncbi:MAG: hypothetical protein AAGM21_10090 [Pseudomonadota bacterium]